MEQTVFVSGHMSLKYTPIPYKGKMVEIGYFLYEDGQIRRSRNQLPGYVPIFIDNREIEIYKDFVGETLELDGLLRVKAKEGRIKFGVFTLMNNDILHRLLRSIHTLKAQVEVLRR